MRQRTSVSDIPDAWIPQRSAPLPPQAPSIPDAWIPRPPRGMPQQTGPRDVPRRFGESRGFGGPVGPVAPRGPRGFAGSVGPGRFGRPNTNVRPASSSTQIPDAWIPSKIPDFVQFQNEPFSIFRNPLAPNRPVISPAVTKDSSPPIVKNTPMTLSTLLETIEDPVETNYSETISMLQNLEQGTYDDVRNIIENPTGSITIDDVKENIENDEYEYEEIEVEVTDDEEDE
jgi:hypothetical protein